MEQTGQTMVIVERALGHYQRPLARLASILSGLAESMLHPLFVLPVIVNSVAGSSVALGLLVAAALIAWLVPQLVVEPSLWQSELARLYPWLMALRAGLLALLTLVVLLFGGNTGWLLGGLLALLALFWATGGVLATGQPAGLLTGVEAEGSLLPERMLIWTGGLTVLVGLLLARLIGPDGPGFPAWLVVLTLLATLMLALAAGLSWRVERLTGQPGEAVWLALGLLPALLVRGLRLRRYLVFRLMLTLSMLSDPFLLIYALQAFELPWQSVGIYLALFVLVHLLARLIAAPLVSAGHGRPIGQAAALMRLLVPLLALTLPLILRSGPVGRLTLNAGWLAPAAFGLVIVLYALAVAGVEAADNAYLREAMAPGHRAATRGLLLLLLLLGALVYIGGGLIVERWGYSALLLSGVGLGLAGILASGLLMEVPAVETRELSGTGALPTFRE